MATTLYTAYILVIVFVIIHVVNLIENLSNWGGGGAVALTHKKGVGRTL